MLNLPAFVTESDQIFLKLFFLFLLLIEGLKQSLRRLMFCFVYH